MFVLCRSYCRSKSLWGQKPQRTQRKEPPRGPKEKKEQKNEARHSEERRICSCAAAVFKLIDPWVSQDISLSLSLYLCLFFERRRAETIRGRNPKGPKEKKEQKNEAR